jgi:hypothetical protein
MDNTVTEDQVAALMRCLPPHCFLRRYVEHAAASTDAHAGYHVLAGLSLLTQAAPLSFVMSKSTRKYPNLYSIVVGPSTDSRKTAAVTIANEVLSMAIPGARLGKPGSTESLYDMLGNNPRQLYVLEEFGAFLAQTQVGYMQPIKAALTEIYDCVAPAERNTVKNRETVKQRATPRLSLLGGSTVEFLERHTEETDWLAGFMARFTVFLGIREREYDPEPDVDPRQRQAIAEQLSSLALRAVPGPCLGYVPEADAFLGRWAKRVAASTQNYPAAVRAGVGRSSGMVHRVAMLVAFDVSDTLQYGEAGWRISLAAVVTACNIIDWHIQSLRALGEGLTPNKDMRDRKAVLDLIGAEPKTHARILVESKLLKYRLAQIMETLLEEGSIMRCGTARSGGANFFYRRTDRQELSLFHDAPEQEAPASLPSNVLLFRQPELSSLSTSVPPGNVTLPSMAYASLSPLAMASSVTLAGSDSRAPASASSNQSFDSFEASASSSFSAASLSGVPMGASTSGTTDDERDDLDFSTAIPPFNPFAESS